MPAASHTRRKFIKRFGLGILSAAALHACAPAPSYPIPPTRTVLPAAAPSTKEDGLTAPPAQAAGQNPNRLVRARCDDLWQGEELSGEKTLALLDASIATLTGIQDAALAWKSLFKPGETVAIKVNAITNGSVHPTLVMTVAQRLQDSGIVPEQIFIYDRTSDELKNSGFPVNRSGKGIRCYGSDGNYAAGGTVAGQAVRLNPSLAACDALINLCILKGFSLGGMSFALKNHYGSVENPGRFHDSMFTPGITGLNALPQIKDRTRLVIGDLLTPQTGTDFTNYVVLGGQNSLLVSRDPVAVDAVGLEMVCKELESSKGLNTKAIQVPAKEYLQAAEKQGLGISETGRLDIQEMKL